MKLKKLTCISLAAMALCGASFAASASVITFDQEDVGQQESGSVSYNGHGGPLKARNIQYGSLSAEQVPDHTGVQLNCKGCLLDFTTGPNLREGTPGQGPDDQWVFASGKDTNFALNGKVVAPDGTVVANGLLLDGYFTGKPFVTSGTKDSIQFDGIGFNTVNADLLSYYGIAPNTPFQFGSNLISLGSADFGNIGFTARVTEGDFAIKNRNTAAVPAPQVLGLFALGIALLGLGMASRRRRGLKLQA